MVNPIISLQDFPFKLIGMCSSQSTPKSTPRLQLEHLKFYGRLTSQDFPFKFMGICQSQNTPPLQLG